MHSVVGPGKVSRNLVCMWPLFECCGRTGKPSPFFSAKSATNPTLKDSLDCRFLVRAVDSVLVPVSDTTTCPYRSFATLDRYDKLWISVDKDKEAQYMAGSILPPSLDRSGPLTLASSAIHACLAVFFSALLPQGVVVWVETQGASVLLAAAVILSCDCRCHTRTEVIGCVPLFSHTIAPERVVHGNLLVRTERRSCRFLPSFRLNRLLNTVAIRPLGVARASVRPSLRR